MSIAEQIGDNATVTRDARNVDLKLEAFAIPVADVDRANSIMTSVLCSSPARLWVLDSVWDKAQVGNSRLFPESLPRDLGYRGGASRRRRTGHQHQRGFHITSPGAQF